jgi:hypothetical protein
MPLRTVDYVGSPATPGSCGAFAASIGDEAARLQGAVKFFSARVTGCNVVPSNFFVPTAT